MVSNFDETRRLVLRLYIAGEAPNSRQAMTHLREIEQLFSDYEFELEVVDTLLEPLRALEDGILVTPTLVKRFPAPETKIIGNLSHKEEVLSALNITLPTGQTTSEV